MHQQEYFAIGEDTPLAAYKRAWHGLIGYAKRIREASFTSHFSKSPANIWCIFLHHIFAGISKRSQRGGLENFLRLFM